MNCLFYFIDKNNLWNIFYDDKRNEYLNNYMSDNTYSIDYLTFIKSIDLNKINKIFHFLFKSHSELEYFNDFFEIFLDNGCGYIFVILNIEYSDTMHLVFYDKEVGKWIDNYGNVFNNINSVLLYFCNYDDYVNELFSVELVYIEPK